jgi:hypothetical protein
MATWLLGASQQRDGFRAIGGQVIRGIALFWNSKFGVQIIYGDPETKLTRSPHNQFWKIGKFWSYDGTPPSCTTCPLHTARRIPPPIQWAFFNKHV